MSSKFNLSKTSLLWLLPVTVMLMSCAATLPLKPAPLPVAIAPPLLPPPPKVEEPPPKGTYLQKLCDFRESLQSQLKLTLSPLELCSKPGPK